MPVYLYCLTDAQVAASRSWSPGVTGALVRPLVEGTLAALISDVAELPPTLRRSELEHHDAVNRAVLDLGVCIPMRYGTMLPARAACRDFIAARAGFWQREIERLRGRVELSVQCVMPCAEQAPDVWPAVPDAGPGTGYLLRRRAELGAVQSVLDRSSALSALLRGSLHDVAEAVSVVQRGRLLRLAALLLREHFELAAARISAIATERGGQWSISDPWPPYSFVADPDGRTG